VSHDARTILPTGIELSHRLASLREALLQPVLHSGVSQKGTGVTVKHREGREGTGLRAGVRGNCDRPRRIAHRPAGARIQNVRIAYAVAQSVPTRVAARREGAALEVYDANGSVSLLGSLDSDAPRVVVAPAAQRRNVATEVDETTYARRAGSEELRGRTASPALWLIACTAFSEGQRLNFRSTRYASPATISAIQ